MSTEMVNVWLSDAKYDDFIQDLLDAEEKKECRYAIYDAEYDLSDGQKRTKLVFFLWYVYVMVLAVYLCYGTNCMSVLWY